MATFISPRRPRAPHLRVHAPTLPPLCRPAAIPDDGASTSHAAPLDARVDSRHAHGASESADARAQSAHAPNLAATTASRTAFAAFAPKGVVQQAAHQPWRMHPDAFGALVFFASLSALCFARVRLMIADVICNARRCKACRGFGIRRCDMCGGVGQVRWDAKWVHTDPCPKCAGKRYCKCEECGGGVFRRHLFQHLSRDAGTRKAQDALASMDPIEKYVD